LIFRISADESATNKDVRILEFFIELKELVCLGSTQLRNINSFPINTILFATDNEYYVTSMLYENLKIFGLNLESNRGVRGFGKRIMNTDNDDVDADISEVSNVRKGMGASMVTIEELREEVVKDLIIKMCALKYIHIQTCSRKYKQI
jgi:hypothetical protein